MYVDTEEHGKTPAVIAENVFSNVCVHSTDDLTGESLYHDIMQQDMFCSAGQLEAFNFIDLYMYLMLKNNSDGCHIYTVIVTRVAKRGLPFDDS